MTPIDANRVAVATKRFSKVDFWRELLITIRFCLVGIVATAVHITVGYGWLVFVGGSWHRADFSKRLRILDGFWNFFHGKLPMNISLTRKPASRNVSILCDRRRHRLSGKYTMPCFSTA